MLNAFWIAKSVLPPPVHVGLVTQVGSLPPMLYCMLLVRMCTLLNTNSAADLEQNAAVNILLLIQQCIQLWSIHIRIDDYCSIDTTERSYESAPLQGALQAVSRSPCGLLNNRRSLSRSLCTLHVESQILQDLGDSPPSNDDQDKKFENASNFSLQ